MVSTVVTRGIHEGTMRKVGSFFAERLVLLVEVVVVVQEMSSVLGRGLYALYSPSRSP